MVIRARRVDADAMRELRTKNTIREIEEEARRRRGRVDSNPIASPNRQLGTQDITDVPTDVPKEKIALDQLGIAIKPKTIYTCPKCGKQYLRGFPPAYCTICRHPSYMAQLNLRR